MQPMTILGAAFPDAPESEFEAAERLKAAFDAFGTRC